MFVESPRDAEAALRKRIVIPADGADDRDVGSNERLGFEPLPAELADAAREYFVIEPVTVGAGGPKLMIAGDEELGSGKTKTRQALLQNIAVGNGSITDHQQHIAAGLVHLVDQRLSARAGARMVVMEVGGDEELHPVIVDLIGDERMERDKRQNNHVAWASSP